MKMKPLSLADIEKASGGKYFGPEDKKDALISGVKRDSREIKEGDLFLCIKGEKVDGHSFAAKAYEAGALCCLCEKELDTNEPYILVDSVLDSVRYIAAYYRTLFDIPFVGITGSVGKTTAKEMTASVLSRRFNVLKTKENLNNELGVPLTVLEVMEEHTAAVIEMGISDFGEMTRLSEIVKPDICIVTTIGYCHLENLGDLDGVLKAKGEVFARMNKNGKAVLCGDDDKLREYDPGVEKVTYGLRKDNDFFAENIENLGFEGIKYTAVYDGGGYEGHIYAFGSHIVSAAMAATAVGKLLGMDDESIALGVADYATVGGRANVIKGEKITVIDDCYNANPNSVKAACTSLSAVTGRKVAILGDMLELGLTSPELHFGTGAHAAFHADVLLCCGSEGRYIYDGFNSVHSGKKAVYYTEKAELISALSENIKEGDTILVKASHGMHFEEIVAKLKEF